MLQRKRDCFRCDDLPTKPNLDLGKILVTGATGYIGGRLVPELLARGYKVRVFVRDALPNHYQRWPEAEIVVGDVLDMESIKHALEGIDTAYYLVHSLMLGPKEFETADNQSANNFRLAAEENGVNRIIYLGGLGNSNESLSPHLKSRMSVADELSDGPIPVTNLRAAVIIGSGSASYEIIKNLIINTPVLLIPGWARTKCQSLSICDVIKYLVACLEQEKTIGKSFDIGGDDVHSYETMIKKFANILGKKRVFIHSPISNISVFAYFASLITPVPASITFSLMHSLKNEVICNENTIKKLISFKTIPYEESISRALANETHDDVLTRWSDSNPKRKVNTKKLSEFPAPSTFKYEISVLTKKPKSVLFKSACRLGGKGGYGRSTWLWNLRGMLDRILLGVGSARGRRSLSHLRINDVIGFWRVEKLVENSLVLLKAEMKLPGHGWLEIKINSVNVDHQVEVTAHFFPKGIWGYLYWYSLLPIHNFIFKDLINQIVRNGKEYLDENLKN